MKAFDKDATCPKCTHERVAIKWGREDGYLLGSLTRTCETCGYTWEEQCADSEESQEIINAGKKGPK